MLCGCGRWGFIDFRYRTATHTDSNPFNKTGLGGLASRVSVDAFWDVPGNAMMMV